MISHVSHIGHMMSCANPDMHKVKNKLEVNCANITPECDDSSTLNCISQDLSEDDTLKKSKLREA